MKSLPDKPFYDGSPSMQKKKKITFLLIRITLVTIALMTVFFFVTLLVNYIVDVSTTPEVITDVGELEKLPLDAIGTVSNDLALMNGSTAARPLSSLVNLEQYHNRAKTRAGTNAFTVGNKPAFYGSDDAVAALNQMIGEFYNATGDDNIYIANAYNSNDGAAQSDIYALGTAFELKYFSAADVQDWSKKDSIYGVELYNWIYQNAYRYGFLTISEIDGSSNASNIFRYVGVPHAQLMRERGLSLSAYFSWVKSYTGEKPFMGEQYAVYYQKGDVLNLPVNYPYTVSRNSNDGYVIVVTLY